MNFAAELQNHGMMAYRIPAAFPVLAPAPTPARFDNRMVRHRYPAVKRLRRKAAVAFSG